MGAHSNLAKPLVRRGWKNRGLTPCASTLEPARKMDLPGDFDESTSRVEMLSDFILGHGFYHGVFQTFPAEIIERMFDQLPAQPLAAKLGVYGQIGNPASTRLAIDPRRDVPNHISLGFSHKDSVRILS